MLLEQSSNPEIAYYSGVVAFQLGRVEQSLELLRKALSLDPKYIDAHNALGTIFLELRRFEDAAEAYEQVVALVPDAFDALVNLGSIQAELGAHEKGAALLERALAIDNSRSDLNNNLGVIYQGLGEFGSAEKYLSAAAAGEPNNFDYRYNLAKNLYSLGNYAGAISEYRAAVDLDGTVLTAWQELVDCLSIAQVSSIDDRLQSDLLACCALEGIDVRGLTGHIAQFIRQDPATGEIVALANEYSASGKDQQNAQSIIRRLSDPLITKFLRRSPIQDVKVERILTALRKIFLISARENRLSDLLDGSGEELLYALAHYCYFTEYVFWNSDDERSLVEEVVGRIAGELQSGRDLDPLAAVVTACYIPLLNAGFQMELANIQPDEYGEAFGRLYRQQVLEPRLERELSQEIPSLSNIEDDISNLVRSQYEENPYPRWQNMPLWETSSFSNVMLKLHPHLSDRNIHWASKPAYLVAGCGTGRLPISIAKCMSNVDILAVDLSLNSLAYAARKSREMKIPNIRFTQADILDLEGLDKLFDVIDCSGVLHHMRDPIEGWECLADRLAPGGFMRIGLYSELARRYMVQGQDFAREQGYEPTADGIRRCRRDVIALGNEDPIKNVIEYPDFYTLSDCRDMLFHVQEHRFTIPKISEAIDRLGLELVGFDFPDPAVIARYKSAFPDDPSATSLDNWHDYEVENPDLFFGMYNFWLRKPG